MGKYDNRTLRSDIKAILKCRYLKDDVSEGQLRKIVRVFNDDREAEEEVTYLDAIIYAIKSVCDVEV